MKRKFQAFWDIFFYWEVRETEEAGKRFDLLFELLVESSHDFGVSDEDEDEDDYRTLLGHPESKGGVADLRKVLIQPVTEKDAAAEGGEEPN